MATSRCRWWAVGSSALHPSDVVARMLRASTAGCRVVQHLSVRRNKRPPLEKRIRHDCSVRPRKRQLNPFRRTFVYGHGEGKDLKPTHEFTDDVGCGRTNDWVQHCCLQFPEREYRNSDVRLARNGQVEELLGDAVIRIKSPQSRDQHRTVDEESFHTGNVARCTGQPRGLQCPCRPTQLQLIQALAEDVDIG